MEKLRGVVERITYANEETGYNVIKIKCKGYMDLVTVVGSGLIKGIGPVYAKKIVQLFGEQTLNIIEEEPDRIIEVPGIGKKRVEKIKKAWQDQKEIKNIMIFLQSNGVSTSFGSRIYKFYGDKSIERL